MEREEQGRDRGRESGAAGQHGSHGHCRRSNGSRGSNAWRHSKSRLEVERAERERGTAGRGGELGRLVPL
jgi:hypothetical protein